jgi:hypothetical protein
MCEICGKYKCPNGCPANYTPRGRRRKNEGARQGFCFTVLLELGMDRGNGEEGNAENILNSNEIISNI